MAPPSLTEGGWEGGDVCECARCVLGVFTSSCAPRIGLQADAVQRARRTRLESPAEPPALLRQGGGGQENAFPSRGGRCLQVQFRAHTATMPSMLSATFCAACGLAKARALSAMLSSTSRVKPISRSARARAVSSLCGK